jgi:hypothetical protein
LIKQKKKKHFFAFRHTILIILVFLFNDIFGVFFSLKMLQWKAYCIGIEAQQWGELRICLTIGVLCESELGLGWVGLGG